MNETIKDITKSIEETYALVLKKNYTYDIDTLNYSKELLEKDLYRLGIKDLEEVKKYSAINVGTGSESIALSQLGAKMTYHMDVSKVAVNSLTKYILDNEIDNISTNLFDLCSINNMDFIKEKCDIVYLNGVLQHLYNPLNAMINIANSMKRNGRIFIRTYRNESWLFFMVSLLRRIFQYTDVKSLIECCIRRNDDKDIYSDLFVCEMFDDIFVPVINIYSYQSLKRFFQKLGFEEIKIGEQTITEDGIPYVENMDTEESIMLGFRKKHENINKNIQFPAPVNQLENFKKNLRIQELLSEWEKLEIGIKENKNLQKEVPNIIYDLYHFASFRRERNAKLDYLMDNVIEYVKKINN